MIGAVAAIVLPLGNATQIDMQIQSGGVHLIAAAGVRTVRIDSEHGNDGGQNIHVTRSGKTLVISILGHSAVSLPFVQGAPVADAYQIVYPANARVEISDQSGFLSIDGERGGATVDLASGSIIASGSHGALDLATQGGDITATLANDWHASSIRMQTANGTIRLSVPRAFHARVDAQADGGSVHDALPRSRASSRPLVWLYTQKGDVWIGQST